MNLIGQCLRGNLRRFKPCCVTRLFYHDKLTEKSEGNDRSQQTANSKMTEFWTVGEYMYKK